MPPRRDTPGPNNKGSVSRLDERRRLREPDQSREDSVVEKIGHLLDSPEGDPWGGPVKLERQQDGRESERGQDENGHRPASSQAPGATLAPERDGVAGPGNGHRPSNGSRAEELGLLV